MATVNYDYMAELELDKKSGLYNLFITTYNGNSVNLSVKFLERRHAMRLYLVSEELFGTTRYVGSLCQLNNILDPFSVRSGDVLFYTTSEEMENLINVPEIIRQSGIDELRSQVKSELINALKKKKNDVGRSKYLNNRTTVDILPPTIILDSAPQSIVDNNKIRIAPDLFSQPLSTPIAVETDNNLGNATNSSINNTEDEVERILVRRFIKSLNN